MPRPTCSPAGGEAAPAEGWRHSMGPAAAEPAPAASKRRKVRRVLRAFSPLSSSYPSASVGASAIWSPRSVALRCRVRRRQAPTIPPNVAEHHADRRPRRHHPPGHGAPAPAPGDGPNRDRHAGLRGAALPTSTPPSSSSPSWRQTPSRRRSAGEGRAITVRVATYPDGVEVAAIDDGPGFPAVSAPLPTSSVDGASASSAASAANSASTGTTAGPRSWPESHQNRIPTS